MNLNVISTGSSHTLMNSNCVVVKRKPGPLNVNNLSDYLSTYDPQDIKEGKLRSVEGNVYIYDLNDYKVTKYDLLLFVAGVTDLGPTADSTQMEGIGYIELTLIGLEDPEVHEVIKLVYEVIARDEIEAKLELDYSECEMNNNYYVSKASNGKYRTYSRDKIDSMQWGAKLVSSIESFSHTKRIAPSHKGYIYDGDYYEMETLDLDLSYGNNLITKLRVQSWNGDYWLEINYSNKETILHNISSVPKSSTPLIEMSYDPLIETTIKVNWHFAEEVYIGVTNMVYRVGLTSWYITKSNLSQSDKIKDAYRDRLAIHLVPGINLGLENPGFIYSNLLASNKTWCSSREVRDSLDSLNTQPTPMTSGITIWENSLLKSYKLLETDMDVFVINEFNNNVSRNVAYFKDKSSVILPNNDFRLIGDGDLMIRDIDDSISIFLGGALNKVNIKTTLDLIGLYFSSSNKLAVNSVVNFFNTFIHKGKFYTLDDTYKLR